MQTTAVVIADSVSPEGKRLLTFQYTAHRFILAEINTHCRLSRNARSSRAVPAAKLIEEVRTNPAMPLFWGRNQPGMSATEELTGADLVAAQDLWRAAAASAAARAHMLAGYGLHKQIANRILEPFTWVHGVLTATEWDNFFGLRLDRAAQPEFRALAIACWEAMGTSTPEELKPGQWHLPYVPHSKRTEYEPAALTDLIKISVARCARVSYRPFDQDRLSELDEDLALYEKLMGAQPIHASPAQHQGTPDRLGDDEHEGRWHAPHLHGNFVGWVQYRKTILGEDVAPLPAEYR